MKALLDDYFGHGFYKNLTSGAKELATLLHVSDGKKKGSFQNKLNGKNHNGLPCKRRG